MPAPKSNQEKVSAEKSPNNQEGLSFLARMVWMMVGNVVLIFLTLSIIKPDQAFLSASDIFFPLVVGVMIAARYMDIKYLAGSTSSGEPATMADFRKYVLILCAGAGALWIGAHIISMYSSR